MYMNAKVILETQLRNSAQLALPKNSKLYKQHHNLEPCAEHR